LILDSVVFSTNQISSSQIFALLLHIFALSLQNLALLFEINCTEINQSQSSNIFVYIITEVDNLFPNDCLQVFMELNEQNHGEVSVFYCGNPALGTTLRRQCEKYKFEFRSEKF
jgi:uncharacterized SAM-dependent methyltransferase